MTESDLILFFVVGVMGINHLTLRLPNWEKRLWLFWITQLSNLLIACYLIWYGIPDFQGQLWVMNLMIALLFIFHIITNNRRLTNVTKKTDNRPRLSDLKNTRKEDEDDNEN